MLVEFSLAQWQRFKKARENMFVRENVVEVGVKCATVGCKWVVF